MSTNIKEVIQKDLDNGKFYSICSNETTFKEYVYDKFHSHTQEIISRIENKYASMDDKDLREEIIRLVENEI